MEMKEAAAFVNAMALLCVHFTSSISSSSLCGWSERKVGLDTKLNALELNAPSCPHTNNIYARIYEYMCI